MEGGGIMCGGFGEEHEATPEIQSMVDQVSSYGLS